MNPLNQKDTFNLEVLMFYYGIHLYIPYYLGHENPCWNEYDFDCRDNAYATILGMGGDLDL